MSAGAAGPRGRPVTEVAVGVLERADGAVLLADRPAGKPYAGYWEFPGGKIEPGETVEHALARELKEELGIEVHASLPWTVIDFDYPHAYVRLHFRRVRDWSGTPCPLEGQRLLFHVPGAAPPQPLLPAAVPALRWVQLPTSLVLPPEPRTDALAARRWIEAVQDRGARAIAWPAADSPVALDPAARAAAATRARALQSRLFWPVAVLPADAEGTGAAPVEAQDGFLDVEALRACTVRPRVAWLAAAARNAQDLARAAALGCDCAVLETPQDADGAPQATLAPLCRAAPLPVYLCLDPGAERLARAEQWGAHGLAYTVEA